MITEIILAALLLSAKCETACQYNGYTGGHYEKPFCVCENKLLAEELISLKTEK
jgi:hypothetical protein